MQLLQALHARLRSRFSILVCLAIVGCAHGRAEGKSGEPERIRAVEFWREYGMSEMALLVRIRYEPSGTVTGRAWMGSGDANRAVLRTAYGCASEDRARRIAGLRWSCELPFPRGAPDWREVLQRLEAAGIENPPQDSPPSAGSEVVCFDGAPWAITVWFTSRAPVIREGETCTPRSLARKAFEARVDSVLLDIERAARVEP